jgi:membrane protein required for colicin V production
MTPADWVDLILCGVVLVSVILGAWRGLMFEAMSLAGWVVAAVVARGWSADVAPWMPLEQLTPSMRLGATMALMFIGVLFAWGVLAWLVKRLMDASPLRPTDRALGAVFGVLRSLALAAALGWLVSVSSWGQHPAWHGSQLGPWVDAWWAWLQAMTQSFFQ